MRLAILTPLIIFVAMFSALAYQPTLAAVEIVDPSLCDGNVGEDGQPPAICETDTNQTEYENVLVGPNGIITRTVQAIVYVSGVLAVLLIIIAGFMYMFSAGNPENTSRARRTIIYALVGMVIAVVGQLIVLFVLDRL